MQADKCIIVGFILVSSCGIIFVQNLTTPRRVINPPIHMFPEAQSPIQKSPTHILPEVLPLDLPLPIMQGPERQLDKAKDDSHCQWVQMTYKWLISEQPAMCIRKSDDALSNVIRQQGRWPDCDDLMIWLKPHTPSDGLFVDVGGNIGSCTVLVAGHGFVTHAFEPEPDNLRYFRSTLARFPSLSTLVHLHGFALGDKDGESFIYRQDGNAGNSVVNVVHPDDPSNQIDYSAMESNKSPIHISTLDAELWPDLASPPPPILLLKMDAQGFETKTLQGARRLLEFRAIKAVQTELAPAFLKAQNSSATELCQILANAGFALRPSVHGERMSVQECASLRGDLFAELLG